MTLVTVRAMQDHGLPPPLVAYQRLLQTGRDCGGVAEAGRWAAHLGTWVVLVWASGCAGVRMDRCWLFALRAGFFVNGGVHPRHPETTQSTIVITAIFIFFMIF